MFKKASGKKNLVGLDIGSSAVKAVELGKKGAALQLLNLGFERGVVAVASHVLPARLHMPNDAVSVQ